MENKEKAPSIKEQRKQLVEFLINQLGGNLNSFTSAYGREDVDFTCTHCGKNHHFDFGFLYNKIKRNQFCSCNCNLTIDDLEMYSLESFNAAVKEAQEEKIRNDGLKKEFLEQEQNQVMYIIAQNREAPFHQRHENKFVIRCKNQHLFEIKYEEVVKGCWCPTCHDEEKYYFKPDDTPKVES